MQWDYPRLRGEYLFGSIHTADERGSPPLARGILSTADDTWTREGITPACAGNTYHGERKALQPRITPAYAGNTRCSMTAPPRSRDHPRLRGEYCDNGFKKHFLLGSPPLTRGILNQKVRIVQSSGITPAYAGNTDALLRQACARRDHPRLRGEYRSFSHLLSDR